MKKQNFGMALFALAILLGMTGSVTAINSDDSDNSTVTVNVATKIAVDISPAELNFTGIEPGQTQTQDENGLTAIEIENIGSENVSQVWLNT